MLISLYGLSKPRHGRRERPHGQSWPRIDRTRWSRPRPQRARCCELPGLGNHCASSWRDARRARCQLNHARVSAPVKKRASEPAALKVHSSMMRDVAGLRWQSQCRRRRPSGQRRPSTKPSRGRARVTHTAPRQPSLPSAEAGRATGGGRSTDGADATECFSTFRNVLYGHTEYG